MPPTSVKASSSERPAALESLRYQAILDTARDAIISIDRNGIVSDYNDAAVAIFEYTAEEVIGRNVSMLMPTPYREEHDGYIRSYQRTGEKKAIGRIRDVEARRKSGEVFPIELSVSEARIGDELLYTAIIRDVSALRRAQAWAEARHEVTRVLAISDTLAGAAHPLLEIVRKTGGWVAGEIWVVRGAFGSEGEAADGLRYEGSAVAPELGADSFGDEHRDLRFAYGEGLLGQAWKTGQAVSVADVSADPAFVRGDLAARFGLRGGVAFPVRDERGIVGVMAFYARDVRQAPAELLRLMTSLTSQIGDFIAHRRAQDEVGKLEELSRERARLADIGAITAKLVHDLGNPLSGISMQAELLQRKANRDDAPAASLLQPIERILAGVSRLRELVRGFTDFAREQRLDLTSIDLARFLDELTDHWKPEAGERDIAVITDVRGAVPALVGDELKLRRVFDNLVKNAVEALDGDSGTVTIRVHDVAADRIRITVADTGPGIPDGVDVFKLFETTKSFGTGIGLPVSKEIVHAHGGAIDFAPNSPRGTVFIVELPVRGPAA